MIKKTYLKYLLLFSILFIISMLFGITTSVWADEIWVYGFSYNISKGMTIYKDFNVLQTPLYFFIGNGFIKLFGAKLISLKILNSIIVSLMGCMLFKMIKWRAIIVLIWISVFIPNGYNLLSLFWIVLILYLINQNKKKDYNILLGIIIGLSLLTKQNIGICLLIPYLYYSKNKLKSIISFLLPIFFLLIYFIHHEALYEFIDDCFLGMLEFGAKNRYISIFYIPEILVVIYLIIILVKSKFKNKEIFYILMFQVVCFPLGDPYHFCTGTFPVVFYLLKKVNDKYIKFMISFSIIFFNICISYPIYSDLKIHTDNDILYLRNAGEYKQLAINFKKYLEQNGYSLKKDYWIFIGDKNYFIKLFYDIPINKYDFILSGNCGYNGVKKKLKELDEICKKEKCIFFDDNKIINDNGSQVKEFFQYVKKNYYEKEEKFYDWSVYTNEEPPKST